MRRERRRLNYRRLTSVLLVMVGLAVMAYPHLAQMYNDYRMRLVLLQIERSLAESAASPEVASVERYRELTEQFETVGEREGELAATPPVTTPSPPPASPTSPPAAPVAPQPTGELLGTIVIERIGVRMPIFYGATDANMQIGTGLIEGTSPLGAVGNSAIAGHRSQRFGRQFNRLNELVAGDLIRVETRDASLVYRVYRSHVVVPTDLSVLKRSRTHAVLTLVTCEPIYPATHRLIVHAVLTD